ncbi:uncharacterized protein isoform X2 [Choristoneura fumiferana]
MKLDKAEFEKIKYQLADIGQEQRSIIKSLKVILDQQEPHKLCRLCLKPGKRKIFGDNKDFNIVFTIRATLAIEISEDDGKPQYICGPCEHTLYQVAKLKETAEITQWRLQQELEMVTESPPDWSGEDSARGAGYFKMVEAEVAREWRCAKCRKVFYSQEEFHEHEVLPSCKTTVASFVCETCGLEMKTMSRLKRHRLIHTGSLPYPCTRCAYRARTRYALAVHARRHSGERPLRCQHCPATFSNASGLASHRRRHQPPRYRCERCQRGFTFRVALENHMATQHSNAKPYNCGFCGKAFSTRKMILRHELKVHNRPKMPSGVLPSYMRQQEDVT